MGPLSYADGYWFVIGVGGGTAAPSDYSAGMPRGVGDLWIGESVKHATITWGQRIGGFTLRSKEKHLLARTSETK